ncbi:UDP-GlcNAc:undecaprenyl-phosphate GlcNAc-1-phosphate transferase [Desulfacinum hydrothermale DSM 13146]|uniref:UDP-GlcNAc:undecaprenyl-phosphate GlcNAc-1-phosphate transferase n=1 Tax=Desulfacinum hydrothermale DSM 13146 TaxID=1121390 RepID=A0A1W1XS99_9BACT|nr:MraY family glycosyltransferase [Desulfacinum hydrothermale]SMC26725.1 UDP-GlcNAc:undecaprenyl-phosphate GlcNAc-1-phosphate transferase [Desulfacinum hydrothermale DSM 13146]
MTYLYQLVAAALLTAGLVPVFMHLAPRWGLLDRPGGRHIHRKPVPRTGGIAMALGIGLTLAFLAPQGALVRGVLAGMAVLLIFGVADDRLELDYRIKLGGQAAAVALFLALSGLSLGNLGEILPGCTVGCKALDLPLTAFFLLAVINSVNLSDGLDGLASGLSLLVLASVVITGIARGHLTPLPLAMCTAGAVIGFLRYNSHPAVVFMGDAGSQILGFLLGATLLTFHRGQSPSNPAVILFFLGVPALDTLTVMIRRILEGRSPFHADRNHVHHMLLQKGLQHHQAVIAIYGLQLSFIAVGLLVQPLPAYVGAGLYLLAALSFPLVFFGFQRLPFDALLRQVNRRILLPMASSAAGPVTRARHALGRLVRLGMGVCLGAFLVACPLWVRPIPHQIGVTAAVFAALALLVRILRPSALEIFVKLGAYFCALYYVISLEFAFQVPLWGTEYVGLYHRLFQVMTLFTLAHRVLADGSARRITLDYLMAGVVLLLFFLPPSFLNTYRVHTIGWNLLIYFLCLETIWNNPARQEDMVAAPVVGSLALTAVLAFWPWIL